MDTRGVRWEKKKKELDISYVVDFGGFVLKV